MVRSLPADLQAKFLSMGPFQCDDITIHVLDGERPFSEEVKAGAEEYWADLRRQKPQLFNGPVWAVADSKVNKSGCSRRPRLILHMQRSWYKFALFTHYTPQVERMLPSQRCNVFGVGALTFTQEGLLILGQRSDRVAMLARYWSYMPVGVVDDKDVLGVLRKELAEELGLSWSNHITSTWCIGLLDCGSEQGHVTNLVFVIHLSLSSKEIRQTWTKACDATEHTEISFLEPSEVEKLPDVTEVTRNAVRAYLSWGPCGPRALQISGCGCSSVVMHLLRESRRFSWPRGAKS